MLAAAGGCAEASCDSIGRSLVVRLEVPTSDWRIEELCVDDQCIDDGGAGPATIEVADEHNPRRYRLRVLSPGGATVEDEGDIDPADYREDAKCPPETTTAVVAVAETGTVTLVPG